MLRSGRFAGVAVGMVVLGMGVLTVPAPALAEDHAGGGGPCAGQPWMDRHRSPDARATLVVAQLTLDEKIQWLGSITDATHSRETPPRPRLCLPALWLNNGSAGVSTG